MSNAEHSYHTGYLLQQFIYSLTAHELRKRYCSFIISNAILLNKEEKRGFTTRGDQRQVVYFGGSD